MKSYRAIDLPIVMNDVLDLIQHFGDHENRDHASHGVYRGDLYTALKINGDHDGDDEK